MRVLFQRATRQGDDDRPWGAPLRLPMANGPRRCVTVHDRHLDIHQNQVEMPGAELLDGRFAISRDFQMVRRVFQVGCHERANVFRIVGQQDAAARGISRARKSR